MLRTTLAARRSPILLALLALVASAAMTACSDPTAPKNDPTTRKSGYIVASSDKDSTNAGGGQ
jgi:hypothetical protein